MFLRRFDWKKNSQILIAQFLAISLIVFYINSMEKLNFLEVLSIILIQSNYYGKYNKKESILMNTDWIKGIVVYSGMETKIMLNQG